MRRRFFLVRRLAACAVAEGCHLLANLGPAALAVPLRALALRLNPHHHRAGAARARELLDRGDTRAWPAFAALVAAVGNPADTSASDLYLTWIPGWTTASAVATLLWGRGHDRRLRAAQGAALREDCRRLAADHFARALAAGDLDRSTASLAAWRSLSADGDESLELRWAAAELAWSRNRAGSGDEGGDSGADFAAILAPLLAAGEFVSPLDPLRWAERLAAAGAGAGDLAELADRCLAAARRLVPEEPAVWRLAAARAGARGDRVAARRWGERALALDPQQPAALLDWRASRDGRPPPPEWPHPLVVDGPAELPLGGDGRAVCRLAGAGAGWTLYVLPAAGRGVVPESRERPFDAGGSAAVTLSARRPDRVHGGPWPLVFVAVGPAGYAVAERTVRVADPRPGRLLFAVTEDHEIQEERGRLPVEALGRLLVEKSRFAAALGVPWTHMVEAGSTLGLTAWAAGRGGGRWLDLEGEVRDHLVAEVAGGNDVQPHLHAFNDPADPRFPYSLAGDDLAPSLAFLLTDAEERGAWASIGDPGAGRDRRAAAARAVAAVEELGRRGDSDYRAVLWRSGLLEYGAGAADRAWSAVALRRAGLLAVSDLPKPGSPRRRRIEPAFPIGWEDPARRQPGGPLLQLPIAADLEGDFRMGPRRLARRARASAAARRRPDGVVAPGVHLFTLITHDKFLNARAGGDELRLDPDYGDWTVARRHLAAWRAAGAEPVTAREGVKAVLADLAWRPVPWLAGETAVEPPGGGGRQALRYRLELVGGGRPGAGGLPHHLLVPIPASLRDRLAAVRAEDGSGAELAVEVEAGAGAFWLALTGDEGEVSCEFELTRSGDAEPAAASVEAAASRGARR